MLIIGLTGSPCTGKTYFSKQISKQFKNIKVIELNDIINKYKAFFSIDADGAKIADIAKLNSILETQIRELAQSIEKNIDAIVYVSHLVPELKIRFDACFVMRAKLMLLNKRMIKRGYSKSKIKENLISEAVDYCGAEAEAKHTCMHIYEIETPAEKKMAEKIIRIMIKSKKTNITKKEMSALVSMPNIDKIPELL